MRRFAPTPKWSRLPSHPSDIRTVREQLECAQCSSAMAEAVAALADELRRPLTAIATSAQAARDVAQRTEPLPAELADAIDTVIEEARRAGRAIERAQRLVVSLDRRYELADVNSLAAGVVELVGSEARQHGITIAVDTPEKHAAIECDPIQIQLVVLNLLRNAIDAMADAEERYGDAITLAIGFADSSHIRIDVMDQGRRLDAETRMRASDGLLAGRGSTGGRSFGADVGLAICRTVAINHSGRLDYRGNDSGSDAAGNAFTVTLPITQPREPNDGP